VAKLKVNLRDVGFAHHTSSVYATLYGDSEVLEWDRACSQAGPTVYTDSFLNDGIAQYEGERVAWLTEPIVIAPGTYAWLQAGDNHKRFVEVWSHNEDVLRFAESVGLAHVFVPGASCFIEPASQRVSEKTKLCSFIGSSKNWAPGHRLRQEVRAALPSFVDAFGHGFVSLESKADGLLDYAYSIAVENSKQDTYFTEKLTDCFTTGAVPIYWGTRRVDELFDRSGIIHFDTIEELTGILASLSMEDYQSRRRAVLYNFEVAKQYQVPEEWGVRGSKVFGLRQAEAT